MGWIEREYPPGSGIYVKIWAGEEPAKGKPAAAPARAPAPPPPPGPEPGSAASVFRGRALEIIDAAVAEGLLPAATIEAVASAGPEAFTQLSNVGERTARNLIDEARRALR